MLTASGSALVAGASPQPMKNVTVKVTRAFLVGGKRQEVGTVLDVDLVLAGELTSAGKAVRIPPKVEAKPEPKVEKPKEKSNAG